MFDFARSELTMEGILNVVGENSTTTKSNFKSNLSGKHNLLSAV